MKHEGQVNWLLWYHVQLIVYPRRRPSQHAPFAAAITSPARKRASWLYHTLAADHALCARVMNLEIMKNAKTATHVYH